ncbi:MAG TPA: hypothetical protein VK472_07635 [Allosphingosinicella sp.]|nr:hypothetical protein [Allosphingosinicella sp.]
MEPGGWIWDGLGIAETGDSGEIRRAYARRLKAIDTEADPGAFIALREARDAALAFAAGDVAYGDLAPPPSWPPPAPEPPPIGEAEAPAEAPEAEAAPPPDPGPRPRMIVAESALPGLDQADLDRIEALLAAPETPAWAELETLTRKLLASPAAERIDLARWLEAWAAERIARFTPRSDPMIEPAVEHFRWDSDVADLNRPPVIDWILQRRIDRRFELELRAIPGSYAGLITRLRRPMAQPPGALGAWWSGVRVEFLIAYLETYYPTVLAGLDGETLAWWEEHIASQARSTGLGSLIREWRRKDVFESGIIGRSRPVPILLSAGIVLMPYIFAWLLLQRGYGAGARLLAFGWLALVVLYIAFAPPAPSPGQQLALAPPARIYGGPPVIPRYVTPEEDIDPILLWMTGDRVTLKDLGPGYSGLDRELTSRWEFGADQSGQADSFAEDIAVLIDRHVEASVRNAPYELLVEFWRLRADMAIYARLQGDEVCEAALRGDRIPIQFPPEIVERRKAFAARAVFQYVWSDPRGRSPRQSLTVPPAIADSAARNAGLDRADLGPALLGRGTSEQRCDARIGLIEAVLRAPSEKARPVLEQLSAGF